MTFTVAPDGTFSGTVTNTTFSVSSPFSGTINDDGTWSYFYNYDTTPGQEPNGRGTLSFEGNNRLNGTITDVSTGTVTLTRQ